MILNQHDLMTLFSRPAKLWRMSEQHGSIVILTGAGISAESGLETFRGTSGLWEGHKVEDVATPEAFEKNPMLVQKFYNERRKKLLYSSIFPNAAHLALAQLEKQWKGKVLIVTQNIDNLHEMAGSRNVLHMHGNLLEVRCTNTGKVYFPWKEDITEKTHCDCCNQSQTLRPNIVWFGEEPFDLGRIFQELEACSLFLSIGTSGQVYPAAGFVEHVRMFAKGKTVELNLEASMLSHLFTEKQYGQATEIIPPYVEKLIQSVA